jgi:hypothetical protein
MKDAVESLIESGRYQAWSLLPLSDGMEAGWGRCDPAAHQANRRTFLFEKSQGPYTSKGKNDPALSVLFRKEPWLAYNINMSVFLEQNPAYHRIIIYHFLHSFEFSISTY